MCIAIYQKPFAVLDYTTLKNSYENNPDGCGMAYINTDYRGKQKIKMYKSMEFEQFYKKYKRAVQNNPQSPFLIHFRIKTHGEVSTFNCHPFKINKNTVFIHNGIIRSMPIHKRMSDTQVFNEKILKKLPKGWLKNEGITDLITEAIGGGSKLIVLTLRGEVKIYNEKSGMWKDGNWFSNSSYSYAPRKYDKWSNKETSNKSYNERKNYKDYKKACDKKIFALPNSDLKKCEMCDKWTTKVFNTKVKGEESSLCMCGACIDELESFGTVMSFSVETSGVN
jgi:predicted glutamine amidotransferase